MSARTCSIDGCDKKHNARGLCNMHTQRMRRNGSVDTLAPRALPTLERLFCYIEKTDTCWLWNGWTSRTGYGRTSYKSVVWQAHRLMYELLVGQIPDGLEIDHLCMVRNCVNPDHLEPVDHKTNVMRSPNSLPNLAKAKTHCSAGHPFDGSYESARYGTRRYCKRCHAAKGLRQYYAKKVSA